MPQSKKKELGQGEQMTWTDSDDEEPAAAPIPSYTPPPMPAPLDVSNPELGENHCSKPTRDITTRAAHATTQPRSGGAGSVWTPAGQHWDWAARSWQRNSGFVGCTVLRELPSDGRLRRVGMAHGAAEHVPLPPRGCQALSTQTGSLLWVPTSTLVGKC